MEERLRFVARLPEGEEMSQLCREFGISRKTGDKIFERYSEHGLKALFDRSRPVLAGFVGRADQIRCVSPARIAQARSPRKTA